MLQSGYCALAVIDMRAFFGLGASEQADSLKVTWPNGKVQEWSDIPADRFIEIIEGDARLHPQRLGK